MYNNLPKTLFTGQSLIYMPTCHSTNGIAASLLGKPEIFEGTVIITSDQTAGKGQRGNKWEAEPYKNFTFSLILKPNFLKVNQQFNLNIAISLGVYDFLTNYLGEKVKIKWPNDIFFIDGNISKKIGGILIQNTIKKDAIENSIIGIGLNINQVNFKELRAISLAQITSKTYDLESIFPQLLESIERRFIELKENGIPSMLKKYLDALYWYKELRTFKSGSAFFKGKISGLDELGRLIIDGERGREIFNFKEVEFIE